VNDAAKREAVEALLLMQGFTHWHRVFDPEGEAMVRDSTPLVVWVRSDCVEFDDVCLIYREHDTEDILNKLINALTAH
jgi:hypothetical protein